MPFSRDSAWTMQTVFLRLSFLWLVSWLSAQSPLTTTYASNNQGPAGGAIYFDLNVAVPSGIRVTGLDLNLSSASGTPGTIEVYTCPTTRVGNQANPAAWTLVASGAVTAAGVNQPSTVDLPSFSLPAGTVGVALKAVGVGHRYTNGTNTYASSELTLTTGEAANVAFANPLNLNRTVNCTLRYSRTIQTLFAPTQGVSTPTSAVYFDVDVIHAAGITVTGLDLVVSAAAASSGQVSIFTCPTGRAGNLSNPSVWSLVGTGSVTSTGSSTPSRVVLNQPIPLSGGRVGMAIVSSLGHRYTPGNGTNQNYSNADLSIACGESTVQAFSSSVNSPRVANLRLLYNRGLNAMQAFSYNFGIGCTSQLASFYEYFSSPSLFDLSNRSMTLTPAASGFAVTGNGAFVAPSPNAILLALTDDSEVLTPVLSTPFPHAGGTASQLMVCSNGFVSVAPGNGISVSPGIPFLLNRPITAWYCQHDYNPAIAGSGRVWFEDTGGVAYITWNGVWNFGGVNAASANTFQFQFHLASGAVTLVCGQMANSGTPYMVGYSPGGPSTNPGSRDLSVDLVNGFRIARTDENVTLNVLQRPIPGNTVSLVTGNIHPNTLFGAVILGLQQFTTGVALDPIGMTSCFQYTEGALTLPLFLGNAATQTTSFAIPNALGLTLYGQSVIYCPGANLNPLGAAASNGIHLSIGSY